jgi:hypothetical protein
VIQVYIPTTQEAEIRGSSEASSGKSRTPYLKNKRIEDMAQVIEQLPWFQYLLLEQKKKKKALSSACTHQFNSSYPQLLSLEMPLM